jgi:hypothetical protein
VVDAALPLTLVSEAPLPDDKMVGVESDGIPSFPETCLKRKKTLKKSLKSQSFFIP